MWFEVLPYSCMHFFIVIYQVSKMVRLCCISGGLAAELQMFDEKL